MNDAGAGTRWWGGDADLLEHPWVGALLGHLLGRSVDWPELELEPRDEMLEVAWRAHSGDRDAALVDYFRLGAQAASLIEEVARHVLGEGWRSARVLDFGCGYGRVTRFLARSFGRERLWVSDLLPGAVAFQRSTLRVPAFPSTVAPEDLAVPVEAFDVIYVGSLFTHLPERSFARWLARLCELLSPRGVLLLTTHDERLLPPEVTPDDRGFSFLAASESGSLDPRDYGSTWVSANFLEGRLSQLGAAGWRIFPRQLGHYQDLVVVAGTESAAAVAKLDLAPGPEGFVERCELVAPGRVRVSGWVRGHGAEPHRVDAWCDESQRATVERLPARAHSDDSGRERPGCYRDWCLELVLAAPASYREAVLLLEAVDAAGRRQILFTGSVERLLLVCASENHRRHHQRTFELAEIILAMKRSRFWRLRRAWFALKRRLGLTTEDPDEPRLQERDLEPRTLAKPIRPQHPPA
jgi:SAM-dependent methyltransferase